MQQVNGEILVAGFKLTYYARINNEISEFCLHGSRISKLIIHYKNFEACNYKRGIWIKEPTDIIAYEAMEQIIKLFK